MDIFTAIQRNNIERVRELIKSGVDVKVKDIYNRSPLLLAVRYYAIFPIIKELIANGADVNEHDEYFSILIRSISNRSEYVTIHELIVNGADVNYMDAENKTALIHAIIIGNLKIIKELIAHGADVNVQDRIGNTPLIYASHYSTLPIIKELILHGADINVRNNWNHNALNIAEKYDRHENAAYIKFITNMNNISNNKQTVVAFRDIYETMTGESGVHGPSRQILQNIGLVPRGAFFYGGYYNKYQKYLNKIIS